MPDNTTAIAGSTVATDDIGGVHYQRVKVGHGADGAYVDASATNPLPLARLDTVTTGTITSTDAVLGTHAGVGVPLTGTPTTGSYVAHPLNGESGFTLRLSGTFGGGTVWLESSVDSTNGVDGAWTTNLMRQSGVDITFVDATIQSAGIYRGVAAGYSYLRVRVTGATAPSIGVHYRASAGTSVTALVASLPPGWNTIGALHPASQFTVGTGTSNVFTARAAATTAATAVLQAAPAAGLSLYVTDVSVSNSGAALSVVSLLPTAGTAFLDIAAAASGGGGSMSFRTPVKLAAATGLSYTTSAASTTVYVTATGYTAP